MTRIHYLILFALMALIIFLDEWAYHGWKQMNPGTMWSRQWGMPVRTMTTPNPYVQQ